MASIIQSGDPEVSIGRPADTRGIPELFDGSRCSYSDHHLWVEPNTSYGETRKSYLDLNYCVVESNFEIKPYAAPNDPSDRSGGHLYAVTFQESLARGDSEAYLGLNERKNPILFFRRKRLFHNVDESNVNLAEHLRFQPNGRVEFVHPVHEGMPKWLEYLSAAVDIGKKSIDRNNQSALEGAVEDAIDAWFGWLNNNTEPDVAAWFKGTHGTYFDNGHLIRRGGYR